MWRSQTGSGAERDEILRTPESNIWWWPREVSVTTWRKRDVVVCSWRRVPDETRPRRRRSFRRASSGTRTSSAKSPSPRSLFLPPSLFPSSRPVPPCFFIRRTRSVLVSTCKWLLRTRVPLILLLYIPGKYEKRRDSDARARLIGSRVRVADERERLVANKLNPIVRDQLLVSIRAISDTLLATLLEGC